MYSKRRQRERSPFSLSIWLFVLMQQTKSKTTCYRCCHCAIFPGGRWDKLGGWYGEGIVKRATVRNWRRGRVLSLSLFPAPNPVRLSPLGCVVRVVRRSRFAWLTFRVKLIKRVRFYCWLNARAKDSQLSYASLPRSLTLYLCLSLSHQLSLCETINPTCILGQLKLKVLCVMKSFSNTKDNTTQYTIFWYHFL